MDKFKKLSILKKFLKREWFQISTESGTLLEWVEEIVSELW